MNRILAATVLTGIALLASVSSRAAQTGCPLPGQTPMLKIELFFGLSVRGRGPVTRSEWNRFLLRSVTPIFPQGLSVYDGYGQWLSPLTHRVIREKSKIMVIAAEDSVVTRDKISQLTNIYRKDFHQQAVGVLTTAACGAF